MNPKVRHIENKKQKKTSIGTNLWAVEPVRKSITLNPWGMYAAGKKEKKNKLSGGRPVGCNTRTGPTTGDPWGQVQSSKKKRGQAGTAGGLGSQIGVDSMEP